MRIWDTKYISGRVAWLTAILFVLLTAAVLALTAAAFRLGRFRVPALCGCAATAAAACLLYRWVYRPYRESAKVLQLFATGYTLHGLFDQRLPLSPEIEGVTRKVWEIITTDELISATKKQAQ
ncbi:MAG: sensor histidine kinase, partial [Clostridiales bacterium]|nr:sensor histidine kinase [Clostridiales bacterium]